MSLLLTGPSSDLYNGVELTYFLFFWKLSMRGGPRTCILHRGLSSVQTSDKRLVISPVTRRFGGVGVERWGKGHLGGSVG